MKIVNKLILLSLIMFVFGCQSTSGNKIEPTDKQLGRMLYEEIKLLFDDKYKKDLNLGPGEKPEFMLYGKKIREYEKYTCEISAGVKSMFNLTARFERINVGICTSNSGIIVEAAEKSEPRFKEYLDVISQGRKRDEKALIEHGLYTKKMQLENGAVLYYIPVLGVGHGIAVAATVIIVGEKTMIIQSNAQTICPKSTSEKEFCIEFNKEIEGIAQNLFKKLT